MPGRISRMLQPDYKVKKKLLEQIAFTSHTNNNGIEMEETLITFFVFSNCCFT